MKSSGLLIGPSSSSLATTKNTPASDRSPNFQLGKASEDAPSQPHSLDARKSFEHRRTLSIIDGVSREVLSIFHAAF